jgi:dCMP deaminase
VKDDEVISTGYVGAPRGRKNCTDLDACVREEQKIARGERYELCRGVHAEMNAIISASRRDMIGGAMYLTGIDMSTGDYIENANCCAMCKKLIINSGISAVYIRNDKDNYRIVNVNEWIDNEESLTGTLGY